MVGPVANRGRSRSRCLRWRSRYCSASLLPKARARPENLLLSTTSRPPELAAVRHPFPNGRSPRCRRVGRPSLRACFPIECRAPNGTTVSFSARARSKRFPEQVLRFGKIGGQSARSPCAKWRSSPRHRPLGHPSDRMLGIVSSFDRSPETLPRATPGTGTSRPFPPKPRRSKFFHP